MARRRDFRIEELQLGIDVNPKVSRHHHGGTSARDDMFAWLIEEAIEHHLIVVVVGGGSDHDVDIFLRPAPDRTDGRIVPFTVVI